MLTLTNPEDGTASVSTGLPFGTYAVGVVAWPANLKSLLTFSTMASVGYNPSTDVYQADVGLVLFGFGFTFLLLLR